MTLKKVSSKVVYENRWMTVREDQVERADGSAGIFGVVDKSDFALIVPSMGDRFILVEQFRYPVGGRYWEFPQGSWEEQPQTPPETLARAELQEETGYIAETMRRLGHLFEAYGYSNQGFDVYLATDLQPGTPKHSHEEQDMRVGEFSRAEVERMIRDGSIKDSPTIAAYALFLLDGS
jgi:ADP-ribose pyrophosphatase